MLLCVASHLTGVHAKDYSDAVRDRLNAVMGKKGGTRIKKAFTKIAQRTENVFILSQISSLWSLRLKF